MTEDPITTEEYFRGALKVIAHWSEVDLSGEWEDGLRGVIRSITDLAREILAARPLNQSNGMISEHQSNGLPKQSTFLEVAAEDPIAIKPLEWHDHSFENSEYYSASWGDYCITKDTTRDWPYILRPFIAGQSNYQTPDAAKAAAQDDYEQRIRSALIIHPASPPDVEAISPLDESAIRRDEREKCAAEVERANWPCVGDARRIASAIRTGGQKK